MSKKDLYRPNVAMIIVSNNYPQKKEIFIAQRNDLSDIWQFPQGGIDKGEEVHDALYRELEEEIGTSEVKIIAEYPEWLSYDFPEKIAKKMKPWKGQKQRYFLVKLKKKASIDINTKHPEFSDYKFVSVDDALGLSASFKKDVYEKVIKYFKDKDYL
jgi:putative (di)nucleoside polyphosphate hydrolase